MWTIKLTDQNPYWQEVSNQGHNSMHQIPNYIKSLIINYFIIILVSRRVFIVIINLLLKNWGPKQCKKWCKTQNNQL